MRQQLSAELAGAGVRARAGDDAALVLTEITSNAIRHAQPLAGGVLEVGWAIRRADVEVWVRDGGSPTAPVTRNPTEDAVGGRGLTIVEALAASWGTRRRGGGQEVWARIPLRADSLVSC